MMSEVSLFAMLRAMLRATSEAWPTLDSHLLVKEGTYPYTGGSFQN